MCGVYRPRCHCGVYICHAACVVVYVTLHVCSVSVTLPVWSVFMSRCLHGVYLSRCLCGVCRLSDHGVTGGAMAALLQTKAANTPLSEAIAGTDTDTDAGEVTWRNG